MKDSLFGAALGTLFGVVLMAAINSGAPKQTPVLSSHAVLAIMACNELKLENESVQTEYNNSANTYEIVSQCSNNVKIHLTVPRKAVVTKEA